ncbi:hypothetical protein EU528_03105 [Candidatus Thorarchaeota archaeon]|nr:MAG: hypothetical protein EU528_03105 [Candidatus Thorarchaeota archaeon]
MVSKIKIIAILSCTMLLVGPMMLYVSDFTNLQHTTNDDVLIVTFDQDDATRKAKRIIEYSVELRNDALNKPSSSIASIDQPTKQVEDTTLNPKIRMSSISVSADNYENALGKHRTSVLVIVAHGSEEGIIDQDEIISWSEITERVSEMDPSRVIIAACHSSTPAASLSDGFGFAGSVDARMAAYLTSALLLSSFDGFSKLAGSHFNAGMDYGLRASSEEIDPLPLGEFPPWWNPWKLAWIVVMATVFYTISPVTAPTTYAQIAMLALGVSGLAMLIGILGGIVYLGAGILIPLLPPDMAECFQLVQNLAGTIAGLIGGGIAAYLSGASYPGLINFLNNLYAMWVGRAAAETATAANPEPISRGLLALSAATLFVTAIEFIFNFGLTVTAPSPPPPPPSIQSDPPPPISGGGDKGGTVSIV